MRWPLNTIIVFLIFLQNSSIWAQKSTTTLYRTPQKIIKIMKQLAHDHTNVELLKIGRTLNKESLVILKITPDSTFENIDDLGGVFIVGGHHGNEGPSAEVVIDLASQVLKKKKQPSWLNRTLYIMPVASPTALSQRSRHTHQHDLNRDYPYPGRPPSKPSFKTVESRAIDTFLKKTKITHAITVHSGIKAVLYPNGFQKGGLHSDDQKYFENIAQKSAKAMSIKRSLPMWDSYPTYGSFIDYAYHFHGIMAVNFEISEKHHPPEAELETISKNFQKGVQAFFNYAFSDPQKDATIAEASQEVSKQWQKKSQSSTKVP